MTDLKGFIPAINDVVTAGGKVFATLGAGSDSPSICFGSGAPSIVVAKGSLYLRTDGSSTSTRLYVCSVADGTWVAITTAS